MDPVKSPVVNPTASPSMPVAVAPIASPAMPPVVPPAVSKRKFAIHYFLGMLLLVGFNFLFGLFISWASVIFRIPGYYIGFFLSAEIITFAVIAFILYKTYKYIAYGFITGLFAAVLFIILFYATIAFYPHNEE